MNEKTRQNPERKSLKAWPTTHRRIRIIQRSMADPETFKEPSQEVIVDMAIGALERERLTSSTPIPANSLQNSLTPINDSDTIAVRPNEKERVERLLAILRSGDADAIRQIVSSIDLLSVELEGSPDVGESQPDGAETAGSTGVDAATRGGVAAKVRKSITSISGKGD